MKMTAEFERYLETPFEFQNHLTTLFGEQSEMVIFDIGACEGEDTIKYSKLYPNSKIYSFEPLPQNFEKIKANIKKYEANNVSFFLQALSDKQDNSTFYVSSGAPAGYENNQEWNFGNKSSSLLPPDKVSEEFEWLKFDQQIKVQTNTLFDFCQEQNIEQIDFVHMDVQGAELLVLKGAGSYIKKIKSIWLEVEKISLYKNQPLKKDIEIFMKQSGFTKIIDTVGSISGDQLYVRKDLAGKVLIKKRFIFSRIKRSIKTSLASPPKFEKISYSQSGEDIIIDFIFTQLGNSNPSYLDIGAHHPYYLSNTALFYKKGSKGINVEPDRDLFKLFPKHRKKDINLNCGVGSTSGEMTLHVMSEPALNTFSEEEAKRFEKEHGYKIVAKVATPIKTVTDIVKQFNKGIFPDLLSVDVEGLDESIIRSIDFKASAPTVICLETISYSNNGKGEKDSVMSQYLKTQGYMVYADTNINTIFVLESKWIR